MPERSHLRTYRRERLRIRFRTFFVVLTVVTSAIAVTFLFVVTDPATLPKTLLPIIPLIVVATAVAVWLLRRQFPIDLSPESIRCCDFWGRYHEVAWGRIVNADVWHLLGLPYLRLRSSGGQQALWMTLSLDRADELGELFSEFVSPDHPIRRAIAKAERP